MTIGNNKITKSPTRSGRRDRTRPLSIHIPPINKTSNGKSNEGSFAAASASSGNASNKANPPKMIRNSRAGNMLISVSGA